MSGETAHKMRINTEIFKAYDIRGLYPGEINEEVARLIGRGFVSYLGAKHIGVSRDMRVSSPGLAAAFIHGAREQGAEVTDYGMLGTDMLYFAVVNDRLEGGAQITASHNPKQYNGIKMVRAGALPLSGDAGLGEIRDMIVGDHLPPIAATPGSVLPRNILFEYAEKVIRQGADIGIAWDGDADRCFFIDGSGEFVSGDFITALLAEAFLLKHPGATVIYDLRASYAVKDTVERYGGRALMNRVGHAFIKRRMRDEDGIFAGEVTGHYYFRDNFYADNGFIPALLMLELMSKKGQSLHDLLKPLNRKYFISGEINTKLASMSEVPRKLEAIEARYGDGSIAKMDGISVDYPDWHFNVRASNTEPLLRLNLEAVTPELMERKRDEVLSIIRG